MPGASAPRVMSEAGPQAEAIMAEDRRENPGAPNILKKLNKINDLKTTTKPTVSFYLIHVINNKDVI